MLTFWAFLVAAPPHFQVSLRYLLSDLLRWGTVMFWPEEVGLWVVVGLLTGSDEEHWTGALPVLP